MDPVIVAGAGPTGLTLALCLIRHEVPVILLDEGNPADVEPHPERTVVLRPGTAGLLARLGYRKVHTDAARWTAWRTLRRRQEMQYVHFTPEPESAARAFGSRSSAGMPGFPGSTGFPGGVPGGVPGQGAAFEGRGTGFEGSSAGFEGRGAGGTGGRGDGPAEASWDEPSPLHLSQDRLRHGLLAALDGHELLTVAYGARIDAVEQDERGVNVHTRPGEDTPDTWWRGAFLVGCDGPRSTVRKLLDIRFPGRTAVDRYAVAALRTALPDPGVALLHRDPSGARGTEVTARPLPRGVWRVDWSLRAGTPPLTADALVSRIRGTLAGWCAGTVPPYELLGSAEYAVHQRLARRWRNGRAFLAGDAAHLLGALGTQGLEEGLRDADNLAWKLALAWHQGASETLLDSYESERRGAVGARLRAADQALPLLRTDGAWHSLRHSVLSGPAGRHAELLTDGHLGRGLLGAPPAYQRSPLSLAAARDGGRSGASPLVTPRGSASGTLVDDVAVIDLTGERALLSDRLGRGLLVLLVAPGTGVWESRHWLTAGLMPQLSAAVAALPAPAELLITESYPGATAHTVLLVRPDGHLVAAMTGCRPAELYAYADLARGGPPHATPPAPEPPDQYAT
ncbi:FAD-dependent monooxygenase, partial [Streptantibioticus silvisoli]